jgi:hypothetical protein
MSQSAFVYRVAARNLSRIAIFITKSERDVDVPNCQAACSCAGLATFQLQQDLLSPFGDLRNCRGHKIDTANVNSRVLLSSAILLDLDFSYFIIP